MPVFSNLYRLKKQALLEASKALLKLPLSGQAAWVLSPFQKSSGFRTLRKITHIV
jgi:hypothetical protein